MVGMSVGSQVHPNLKVGVNEMELGQAQLPSCRAFRIVDQLVQDFAIEAPNGVVYVAEALTTHR